MTKRAKRGWAIASLCGVTMAAAVCFGSYHLISFYRGVVLGREAYTALALGNYDRAIDRFNAALQESLPKSYRSNAFVNRGAAYNFKWRFDEAIADFDRALKLDAKMAEAHAGRGAAYQAKGEPAKALIDFNEALRRDPDSAFSYQNRGYILFQRGDWDHAILDYDQAVRRLPRNADLLVMRGLCYVAKKDFDGAMANFDGAIATDPTNANAYMERSKVYWYKGDNEKRRRDYEEALRLKPSLATNETPASGNSYFALATQAKLAYENGDFDSAITLNSAISALNVTLPQASSAIRDRGNAYMAKGNRDQAMQDYDDALKLNPKDAGAYVNRGLALAQQGDADGAMKDYSDAIHINPDQWQAYFNRAADLSVAGRLEEALTDLAMAIKLNPKFPGSYVNRAGIYLKRSEHKKAIDDCNKAIELDPSRIDAYLTRSMIYIQKKEFAKANDDLEKVSGLKPAKPEQALNAVAWFRATCPEARLRDGKKALEAALKACDMSQWKQFAFIDTLAAAYAEAGDFEHAVEYQKKVVAMTNAGPKDSRGILNRLELYEHHKPYHEEIKH